jgi:hypothetical protein
VKCEQPGSCEEGIGPAFVDIDAEAEGDAPFPFEQERAQSAPDKPIDIAEGGRIGLLEVTEPASKRPIEVLDDHLEAVASRHARLRHDASDESSPG